MRERKDPEEKVFGSLSRRDFLQYCGGLAAVLTLPGCGKQPETSAEDVMRTLARAATSGKPPVIWLEGQDCAGCSIAFLNLEEPSIGDVLLKSISLRYHETVMAASGKISEAALAETMTAGGYILVVEGSVPAADDRFCTVGGRPFREILDSCAKNAGLILAVGACASFGGLPGASPSQGKGVSEYVTNKPLINLPMCPAHPEHVLATIVYYLQNQKAPALDGSKRPTMFYGSTVHSQCERRRFFTQQKFLADWNDPAQASYCLYQKGCRGRTTYADCPTRKFNGKVNHCIGSGSPCQGCAEPSFYRNEEPLFAERELPPEEAREWGVA